MSAGKAGPPTGAGRMSARAGETAVTGPDRPAWDEAGVYDYDPGFFPAVSRGTLTPAAASARGQRRALIQRLITAEKLSPAIARRVADGELSIATARRMHAVAQAAARAAAPARRRGIFPAVASAVAGASLFVALGMFTRAFIPGPEQETVLHPARHTPPPLIQAPAGAVAPPADGSASGAPQAVVLRDDEGRITRIKAPSPSAVLDSFVTTAAAGPGAILVGVDDGPFPSGRICRGVYRVAGPHGETRYGLPIRWDNTAQVWVAGNGRDPIRANVVP